MTAMIEPLARVAPETAEPALLARELGRPRYDRRLTDKVLAAFNHAYAVGAVDIARSLRAVLAAVEAGDPFAPQRRQGREATAQADHWVAFVEARNLYRAAAGDPAADPAAVEQALGVMRDAYRRWSAS